METKETYTSEEYSKNAKVKLATGFLIGVAISVFGYIFFDIRQMKK